VHFANKESGQSGSGAAKVRDNRSAARSPNMPIYEYTCHDCGSEFEKLVRSDTVPECPSCRSTRLDKRVSVFATAAAGNETETASPCARCGNPDGPGSCALH
jgi:putative FmdB family regulatory protein